MIKILIVDDHYVVREGLKQILELEKDIHVIGMVPNGFDCLNFLDQSELPDLIFMDLKMPDLNGIQTTQLITQKYPHIKIIMLTVYSDQQYIIQAIQAGAKGYVLKDAQRSDLIKVVYQVFRDQEFIDPALTKMVFTSIRQSNSEYVDKAKITLTRRELEVLYGLVNGKNDKKIAETLFLSEHTVRTHLKNIYRKLAVSSRSQAVVKAIRNNLIDKE